MDDHSSSSKMRRQALSKKARELAEGPGVYLFKDESGHVLYVGKAISLRSRVASYFTPSTDLGPRKQPMLDLIEEIDVIETEGEWDALLLESRLIKDTRPRFNVLLKDDKTYPYLVVTTRESYPGVYITRVPSEHPGARVFGPFTSSGALREAMQLLQQIFKFRTCHLDITARAIRPIVIFALACCMQLICVRRRVQTASSKTCIARILIDSFVSSGRNEPPCWGNYERRWPRQLQSREYEQAASLRDQVEAIEKLSERETRRRGRRRRVAAGSNDICQ